MDLIIHRGTHEIGGSCVEISTATTRLIIDAGAPLEPPTGLAFDETSRYPKVPGLFGKGPRIDALLLSHAHGDHSGLIADSLPDIPVWLSRGTSKMLMAGSIFARQADVPPQRQHLCQSAVPFTIGDIRITPFNVDHSTFDALAFLIEADGKRLLYSGDLRLHGRKPGMAARLVRAGARKPLDVLVMEGTHVGSDRPERGLSERDMETKAVRLAAETHGIVLAMFSPLNLDRLVTYFRVAKRSGRTLVLDPYAAFVLHLVKGQVQVPDPFRHDLIRIHASARFWSSRAGRCLGARYREKIERVAIAPGELMAAPHRWLMLFRPRILAETFAGEVPRASLCLYSYWTGYLDKPELRDLRREVEAGGSRFEPLHASGHIHVTDLASLIRQLDPQVVVPIHTANPAGFGRLSARTRLLTDGAVLQL